MGDILVGSFNFVVRSVELAIEWPGARTCASKSSVVSFRAQRQTPRRLRFRRYESFKSHSDARGTSHHRRSIPRRRCYQVDNLASLRQRLDCNYHRFEGQVGYCGGCTFNTGSRRCTSIIGRVDTLCFNVGLAQEEFWADLQQHTNRICAVSNTRCTLDHLY